ncbi:hypothetical protein LZZ85_00695 [Terrimonas sp. NA20]|uniref:Restriction endonuclease n=1 Tax=Terrimonas ginsenosidimutans TaxID=2908004 RepID=A0ABS9KKD1_9BACT|nr:BsuBI/PstI family type II restriction endonuclease [Terrimonas ginsenosidimutans]MCG2612768.1 hypothetical protein [Terrimonas ginsenosidimutans]
MKDYLLKSKKSPAIHKILNEALDILESVGIPFSGKSERALENMAMAFLAVVGISSNWKEAMGQAENRHLTTRAIIKYINEHFEEQRSFGSYDDIREHLKLPILAELVLNSADNPSAAKNDPTRGYTVSSDFKDLIVHYKSEEWGIKLKLFVKNRPNLSEILLSPRDIPKIKIKLPSGHTLEFSQGGHNQLQREIIEEFLPRYGNGCEVLYVGDAANKYLLKNDDRLLELGFFDMRQGSLPDIVAYDASKNWLYLIEAFYSAGPMSDERIFELKQKLHGCTASLIFITAFISKAAFRKNVGLIGWESEVWTADNPDHLIHFNGDKFFGPYKNVNLET